MNRLIGKPRVRVFVSCCGAALALSTSTPAAPPDWWDATAERGWVRNMPDFYQHQPTLDQTVGSTGLINIPVPYPQFPAGGATTPSRIRWQQDGGYCGAAAMLDTMYHWNEKADYRGLIQDPNIRVANAWLGPASNNIAYNHFLGNTTGGDGMRVNAWFNTLGFGIDSVATGGKGLVYRELLVEQPAAPAAAANPHQGKVGFKTVRPVPVADRFIKTTADIHGAVVAERTITAMEYYKQQIVDNGYTANVRIANRAKTDARQWWGGPNIDAGNFHLVAGAGLDVNGATRRMYIADPDSNKGSRGAESGITGNTFAAVGAVGPIAPAPLATPPVIGQPGIPAGTAIKVDAARKHDFAALADRPVPIPGRVVAGDGSTRGLAAGFDRYYGFWDIGADGFTITDNDRNAAAVPAEAARYASSTIRALGITSTLNVGGMAALPRALPGPDGRVDFDTTVAFTNDILSPIDQIMFFPAQGALSGGGVGSGSLLSADPWGNSGSGLLFDLVDLTGAELDSNLSIALSIGTPGSPMSEFDVFFHNSATDQWNIRSTADGDVFYGLQVPSPGALGLLGLGLLTAAGRRRR